MTKKDFDFIEYVDDMFSCNNSLKLYNPIVTNVECLVKARNILAAVDNIEKMKKKFEEEMNNNCMTEYLRAYAAGFEDAYKMISKYFGEYVNE